MARATLLVSTLTLLWCSVLIVKCSPTPEPAPSPAPKDLGYLSVDDNDEMPILEDFRTKPFGELRTVLSTIKAQFREIIEELMSQVLNYVLEILSQIKRKLLKKLAVYNVSDVLRVAFDGVTDFFVEPVPEYYEPVKRPISEDYGYRPYSLASLFASRK